MAIKLVAIDIDGTLLNNHHEVTPEVKQALKKAEDRGVTIVLCTGRPLPGVQPLLNELALLKETDYVITYNGSLVQNTQTGAVISRYGLSSDDFITVEAMARRVGSHLHVIDEKFIYTPNRDISPYTVHESSLVGMAIKYRSPEEIMAQVEPVKMMMIDEPDILDQAIAKLPESFKEQYTTVKSADFYYEILNKEASKGAAIAKLAAHLGIKQEEIMAIGDNENDLSMIEYAGVGVAMGNATPAVKEAADVLTTSNEEHGVAEIIKQYILEK
ncbi:sugar-phosphatase [Enterococcus sp. JM4C]|uniref:sugar-phosphatase n=1 Tax=Candidatus Enterococcus huntleyi TaxID=1857217 RepID=UPI001379E35B|nr:sugar-phosphatase [Enterococcus sp. JM4C]KAF1295728.1 sugar-phosphatase [Enterococcus sp. JM4C]